VHAPLKHLPFRDEAPAWRTMSLRERLGTVFIWAVFALYVAFLLKLLLFSRPPGSEQSLNLIPFSTISEYLFSDAASVRRSAIGNIVAFAPLGLYLPLLRRDARVWANVLIIASTSIAVEVVQGTLGPGSSDIDDVILNTVGGLVGVLCFTLLRVLLRRRARVIAAVAGLSVLAVPILCYLLFVIRLQL
jgi:glycopeptide antibiotics resistance protein